MRLITSSHDLLITAVYILTTTTNNNNNNTNTWRYYEIFTFDTVRTDSNKIKIFQNFKFNP